jgi:hypothetical protein
VNTDSRMISRDEYESAKTCAEFDLAEELCVPLAGKKYPVFMDPAGMDILQRIAQGLRAKGYEVSEAKPAKGIEAGFSYRFDRFCDLDVLLGVERRKTGYVSCYLITRWFAPFFLRQLEGYERPGEPALNGGCVFAARSTTSLRKRLEEDRYDG